MVVIKEKPKAPLEPPPRELSPTRVVVLLVVLCAIGAGVWQLLSHETSAASAKSDAVPVYSPYVDVTNTPTYPFQLPSSNPVSSVYLAFVVSDTEEPCTPSWGTFYTLDSAEQGLDLDARTAQLRSQGGSVMISYGGEANTELAVDCTDPSKLEQAYLEPVQRYHAKAIDLDIEGANLANTAANARRATAVAAVQKKLAAERKPLKVWMTLPVSSHGLTAEGIAAVHAMLKGGVTLAGVNAMTMDFGEGEGAAHDMLGTIERSLDATQLQVQTLWRDAGLPSSASAAWGHVGVTPMLGVNDVTSERFTTKDARGLAEFVNKRGIPRVSAWSLNRDTQCGGAFAKVGELSNTCSGVVQKPLEFTHIFSGLRGTKTAGKEAAEASSAPTTHPSTATDDPATSPYPIWRSSAAYPAGYKVVWQGQIYQSGWWNQGTPPGTSASDSPNGPWQPIGPVPAGSQAPKLTKTVRGNFPGWSPTRVYHEGDRVTFQGLPYEARWYTQGEQPLNELPSDPSAPWEPLFKYPGEPTSPSTGETTGASTGEATGTAAKSASSEPTAGVEH
ncbi:MAG TPA: chitinase [Solirubrobacterales bacterium]|nr:chitinase [Solirubrobacterales bacterium]